MQTYDLVAIDIDGTLLDSHSNISPTIRPLLRAAEANGVGVTLISGRAAHTVAPLLASLELTLPFVSSGGAHIMDPVTEQTIAYVTLSQAEVSILAELGRAAGASLVAMESRSLYHEGDLEKFKLVHEAHQISLGGMEKFAQIEVLIRQVDDIVQASKNPAKFTFCDHPEVLASLEEKLAASGLPIYYTFSSPVYLETTHVDANKGTALRQLAQHLSIPLERVLAIGDSPNDLSMFEIAGTAVAMGNASARVKAAAHLVAPSNDEDGVAWVLRELVLKNGDAHQQLR